MRKIELPVEDDTEVEGSAGADGAMPEEGAPCAIKEVEVIKEVIKEVPIETVKYIERDVVKEVPKEVVREVLVEVVREV